jgi:catechol 2,3-dioxygenase-like lactoylglutathione lyase family enzyme
MGFSRRWRGKDGKPRYTAYYRDLRGREVSAGTFARKAGADAAWHAAEVNARAGLRHDPGRGRQRFGHYAGAVWLPNHRMELSTRAGLLPTLLSRLPSEPDDLNVWHGVVVGVLRHNRNLVSNRRGRDPAVVDRDLPACRAKP